MSEDGSCYRGPEGVAPGLSEKHLDGSIRIMAAGSYFWVTYSMVVIGLSEHAPTMSKEIGAKYQSIEGIVASLARCRAVRRVRRMACFFAIPPASAAAAGRCAD